MEIDDSAQVRIDKIVRIIEECKYAIHDLSRTDPDPEHNLPRFNIGSPKSTVHHYFMLWEWDGTLERIHHALYVMVRDHSGPGSPNSRPKGPCPHGARI